MTIKTVAWKFLPVLLILLLLLTNVPVAQAADPTSNAADTGGNGNGFETTPNNAHADGGGSASNTNGENDRHRYFNFNIPAIPASQAVTGIVVRVDGSVDNTTGTSIYLVELSWNGGTNWTAAKTTGELTTGELTFNLGNTSDVWGHTWTAAELSNANFRVRITSDCSSSFSCNQRDFFLDYIAVQVTTAAETTPPTSSATSPAAANAPFTVTATATDAGSGVANVGLFFRGPTGNWTQLPGSPINAPGPYQLTFTPGLGEGNYRFQSVACDNNTNCETAPSGNSGNGDSTTLYDNSPPTSQANPPSGPIASATIAVPWTANGNISGIATNGIRLRYNFNGGSFTDSSTASGTSGTFNFTPPNGDGTYCFYTIATDSAGNVETAPVSNDGCTIYRTRATISGLVWLDADGDGSLDGGETGLDGVTVTLSQGGPVLDTDITSGGGAYLFDNLTGGTYTVTVTGGVPAGFTATSDPTSPRQVTVPVGQDFNTANFGYGPFAIIGDLIYQDTNRNGAFNNGEPGLPNITVWLYADGNILRTASTNAAGFYALRGVPAGNYTVLADANDPDLPVSVQATGPNPVTVANVVAGITYSSADIGFNTPPPVTKQLYLRGTSVLSRTQPTGGTHTTRQIINGSSFTWQQTPALIGPLAVTDGQSVLAQLRIDASPSTGLICGGQNPDVLATLRIAGGATLDTDSLSNIIPGLTTHTFTFNNITAGTVIPANARLELNLSVSGADCGAGSGYIIVNFDSANELSRLEIPTSSYIKLDQDGTFDAVYPGGAATPTFIQGDTVYIRATASDPFGAFDISGAILTVPGVVTNTAITSVASSTSTKTFERALSGLLGGNYTYTITATEGLENQVTAVATGTFQVIVSNLGNSTKTVDKATAVPGDVLTYTIVLSNTGGLSTTVRMTDTLPANVTYLSGPTGAAGATYNVGLNAVLFNGLVPANNQVVMNYRVTVDTPLNDGTIIANNTTIDDGFSRFDTSPPATTVIHAAPNLSQSTKSVNLTSASPGDALEYTIILSNTGNMSALINSNNPVLDQIPANTTFINNTLFASGGQISYNAGFNRVEWSGVVPAAASVTIRYQVLLASVLNNGTVITNTANINEGTNFPTPQSYQRVATTTITSAPNLTSQSAKLVDKLVAAPGDTLLYTLRLVNAGNMHAPGVVLSDTLPSQVTFINGSLTTIGGGVAQYFPITRTVVWQGDLNVGTTVQVLFQTSANSPLPNNTQITNVAHVTDGAGNFAPFDLSASTLIQSVPNLNSSAKTVNTATAVPGDVLTYTLRLVNTGNAIATVSLVDTLPSQLQNPVVISASSGTPVVNGNIINWTGQVTPTQPVTITFRATLLSVLNNGTVVANTAQINDGVNSPFFINPAAVTTINSAPNLSTSIKRVDRVTAAPNDLLLYTIALTNTGNMVANTLVRDVLPANVTFEAGSLSASPGAPLPTYSSIDNRIDWQGNVTPGTPITVSYRVRIASPLNNGTVIQNNAQIDDDVNTPFDTTPPAQTTIVSAPDLSTSSKAVDLATATPGDLLHYTIRLVNSGNSIASSVSVSDTLPAQVTFSSGPFVTNGVPGSYNPGQRRFSWLGSVTPGSDVLIEYFVTVNSPLANGTQIVNDAVIQGSFGTITTTPVTTTVQSDHQLSLNKNAPTIVGAGQAMTYTLEYNVTGNEPAPTVIITDTVPANTAFASCTPAPCSLGAGNIVTWTLGNLNPGSSGVATLRVNVTSPLPNGTVIPNTARISDTDNGSAQSSASTTVTSGHGFSLTKRDTGFDPVQAGAQITYNIDWAVSGAETPQSVVITDVVPISTTYVSCGGAVCSLGAGNVVSWTLNNPNPGASGTVSMTVTVANPLPNGTILTNQARISDSNGGIATTATEQTTVNSSHSLDIEKSAPVSTPSGGQITYQIAYTVTGNEASQNLIIEDTTPPNTTFVSATGATTIDNPGAGNTGLVRWRLGNRTPGSTGVVTLVVNVANPLPNGTTINNTAIIQDSNSGTTDVDSASTTVTSGHGFTLSKSDTPDPVAPNGIINYTIHWQVTGNEPAQNVTITDTIPANTTFFGCGGCAQQGGTVQWNLGNHSPGENGDVTLQVQVNNPLANGTVIPNTARIFDGNSGTAATASTTTTVQSGHNLTLSKSAPSIVQAGQDINYTLNWAVTGNEGAPGVVVTDAIPANTTYVVGSCSGCTVAGNIVTWNLGNLVPGNSGSLDLAVTTSGVLTNGTRITNTARITDTDAGAALASAVTTISSGHGFSLTKSDNVDPVQAGTQLTYTIDWSVIGSEQAQNVVISDTLPANTTFASCTPAPCSLGAGNTVTWNRGNQNPNAAGSVSLTVNVAGALANGTILSNQARIGDSNGGLAATSNTEQTTVNSSHSLAVNKTAPATVASGGQIVYTIAYTVSGNEPAQNVVIEDNTPVNTTFASAAGATTINNPGVGNSGLVRWNLPSPLNPGATGVVTLTVNVLNPLANGTPINNTASIRDSNNGTTGQDSTATTVSSGHTLTLTKSDSPDPVSPGNFINYTIHWTVAGNEPAQNLIITDTIPISTAFFGCSGCSQQGSTVQWNLGTRSPGESGDVTLQVQVNNPLPNNTVIGNTARISDGNGGAPVTASTTTTVQSSNQLTLSKSAPSIVQAGQTINYTLNWAVTGNQAAPGVIITDTVPVSTTFINCGGAACSLGAGNIVTWTLGNLVPGNSGSVTLAVTAGNLLPNGTVITNTAHIRDTNGAAAQGTASTTVSSGHGFSLTKTDNADPVQAGTQLTYTIGWGVIGTEQAQAVVISDTLPANTTFATCTPAPCGLGAGNVVTWTLGNRNPNTSGTVSLTVNVNSPLANGTLLSNQARIGDNNGGLAATSNIEQTTVGASHSLAVNKTAPATVAAGGQIVYTLTWAVSGNEPAQNVVVEDNTPVNTTFASAAGATTIDNPGVGNTGLVRWNLGLRNPGATGVVTLTVNVLSPLTNGTPINNTASIRDSNNGTTGQDTTTTTISSGHGFNLSKTDTPDPVSPNNLINYTIHWEVTGNETAQNVVITDTIPANTTFFSCSGCSQQGGGTFVQWNLGNRGPGESGDLTLQVRVNPLTPNGTVIPNTARIFDNNNGTRATASTTTTVQSGHTLTIDKRAPAAVAAGQQIVYTIDYNVVGDELAPSVVITDPIPAGTTYVANSCTAGCTVVGNVVTWNLGNLNPGSPGQVQFAVRVDNNVPNGTEVTNIAYISDSSGASATDTTITRVGTDLLINLADNRETVQPGQRITYTASYSGTEPLNFGSVEIDLPANTTFVSASGGYLQTGNTYFWLVTSQPAGFSGQRFLVVQLPPVIDNGTVVSTTARIAGDGKSNRDDESAVVVSQPNLSNSIKSVSDPGARAGGLVTYQIVLSNTGNMHAYNTIITDVIPAEITYLGPITASSGTATFVGGAVRWNGQVRVGTPVTISFSAQVKATVLDGTAIENVVDINDGFSPNLIQKIAIITVGAKAPASGTLYLPILVVGSATTPPPTGPEVELTITNCGDVNAVGAFWVDLYFNPNEQSPFWPISHGEGFDWFGQGAGFTVSTLGPGQSISLYLSDAVLKNMPAQLPASARLYAQVDLFDKTTPDLGVVYEGANGETNNVGGTNGSPCKATPGQPDLIVESIRLVGTSSGQTQAARESAQAAGGEVAPARVQPPQSQK